MTKSNGKLVAALPALVVVATALAVPATAGAQAQNLINLLLKLEFIVGKLVPIAVAIAIIVFIWGLIKFLVSPSDKKDEAKDMMLWGIIALFLIVAIGGIIQFIAEAFGVTNSGGIAPPVVDRLGT